MSGRWDLQFNVIDWEFGWCRWMHENFSIRPFIGLKGGWINQTIKVTYEDLIINHLPTTLQGKEKVTNNFFGIGPMAGVNTRWKIGAIRSHLFSLIGDFSMATLYGIWSCSDHYKNELSQTSSVSTKDSQLGALMFQGFLGFEWQISSQFKAKLGYEAQLWMNQLRVATFQLQRLHNDLTLQGITFRCLCNF